MIAVVIIAVAGASGGGDGNQTASDAETTLTQSSAVTTQAKTDDSSKITMEEFQSLKNGITYEEAVAIIGGEGTLSSEIGAEGEHFHTITYTWEGNKFAGNATAVFRNGKLASKAQIGLE